MVNYEIGHQARITARFAGDPAVVRFEYLLEATGDSYVLLYGVDAGLVRDSVGVYHVDLDTTASSGVWGWRFYGTGANADAFQGSFYVRPNVTGEPIIPPPPPVEPDGILWSLLTPSGTINGTNITFTLPATPVGSTEIFFINSVLQIAGLDYTRSGDTITCTLAPQSGDRLRVWCFLAA